MIFLLVSFIFILCGNTLVFQFTCGIVDLHGVSLDAKISSFFQVYGVSLGNFFSIHSSGVIYSFSFIRLLSFRALVL